MDLYIEQKVFSLTQDFDIYDINQRPIYHVKGTFLSLTREQRIYDVSNNQEVAYLRRKILSLMPRMEVFVRGRLVETIRQRLTFLSPRYDLDQLGWRIQGNILQHDYDIIDRRGTTLARINKRFFAWSDTFEVSINDQEVDPVMVLAVVLAIDAVMDDNN